MAELPFLAGEQGKGPLLVLLFFISAAVIMIWGTWEGVLPFSEEAVLAETAREILVTGDGWTMHFDGAPVYDAPPLAMWCMSFFLKYFGLTEFTARLPFVIFSVATLIVVFLAGSIRSDDPSPGGTWITQGRACGLLSAIILASSPLFGKFAPHITEHIPFTFFVALSLLGWLYLPVRRRGLFLWGIGVAGALLAGGAPGFLVIPAAAVSAAFDRKRRTVWRDFPFIIVTICALIVGGSWILSTALRAPGAGLVGLSAGAGISAPAAALLGGLKEVWLRNLPWSVPATGAIVRLALTRRDGAERVTEIDNTLIVFLVILFIPLALAGSGGVEVFLALTPIGAIVSAREIGRWLRGGEPAAGRDKPLAAAPAFPEAARVKIWSLNQALISLFFLLMLLLVATPLRLHRTSIDPIKEIASVANEYTPEGTRLGNFRQEYRYQAARLLFYGNRSLEQPLSKPEEVIERLRREPRALFFSSAIDMSELIMFGNYPKGLRVHYRAGELVLFGLDKEPFDGETGSQEN
jgi:4-amino-4-deoxy-L-arabinose transferase-like glycosyltransferase